MKISGFFYSIQGEGSFTGQPAIFIRFYDCNLSCDFCDEKAHHEDFSNYTTLEILQEICHYPAKFIVLTGGEPSLYNLIPLITTLKEQSYYVCVETNGYRPENIAPADWITYSPKDLDRFDESFTVNEVKLVVNQNTDIDRILKLAQDKSIPFLIQPEAFKEKLNWDNIRFCVSLVKKHPHLRLSLQTHKLIKIE
ncbi:MAG: 7-carboxy-7-deazaguanine synthase QueE [Deltaproteobacteria bacterium]|nr:7-carboxy-7-deazaguanine synthase QueE [Deltaproteobacteria bacterium]